MSWSWCLDAGIPYLTIPEWQVKGIEIGFSTRVGGVSQIPYDTLNLGLHVGDNPLAVLENRKRWLDQWGISWLDSVVGEQVHGTNVLWVNKDNGGQGIRELESAVPAVDGLVTQTDLGLMQFFADCVPLFFYHPELKAVGIAHSGWKGTAQKIGQKLIESFEERGGRADRVWAAIGPSIGPCCYQVDERVAEQFRAQFSETPFLLSQGKDRYLLDLWEANRRLLIEKGVRPENIATAAVCTADNPQWFYSHRRDGALTGRMAGWIRIRITTNDAGEAEC